MATDILLLIAELGAIELVELDDDIWLLVLDEDLAVQVECDEPADFLMLSAELGAPPQGQELAAYRLLLQATAAWRETGGLRMGLDPIEDVILQFQELRLAGLDREAARERVARFADAVRNGRRVLAAMSAQDESPTRSSDFLRA